MPAQRFYRRRYQRYSAYKPMRFRRYYRRVVRGRGSYATRLAARVWRNTVNRKTQSKWLAPALGVIGGALGSKIGPVGTLVGGALGKGLGSGIHQVTGFGKYSRIGEGNQIPQIVNRGSGKHGVTIINHREYLCDIITSATPGQFNLQNFFINPGQSATFPWLSQVAQNYEEYQMQGTLFEFRTMSADALNSTNTALGSVIMATEYNAANPNFQSKGEMESYEFSMSEKPSESMIHPIECDPKQTPVDRLYVRPGALPAGQDQRLYDLGNFQIATTGMQGASVNIGELWVSYQVALYKPKLYQSLGLDNGYYHSTSTTGITNATPLGTANTPLPGSNLGITITSGTTINFPLTQSPASYIVITRWQGGAVTWNPPSVNTSGLVSGASPNNIFLGGSQYSPQSLAGVTSGIDVLSVCCPGQYLPSSIIFGAAGTLPSSVTGFHLVVTQVPNNAS